MSRVRPTPIRIIGRCNRAGGRRIVFWTRMIQQPGFSGEAAVTHLFPSALSTGRVPPSVICTVPAGVRRAESLGGWPIFGIPGARPVASAHAEVHGVIRDSFIGELARVISNDFFEFFALAGTKKQIGGLLIRLQKIEPGLPKIVIAPHLKCVAKARLAIIAVEL